MDLTWERIELVGGPRDGDYVDVPHPPPWRLCVPVERQEKVNFGPYCLSGFRSHAYDLARWVEDPKRPHLWQWKYRYAGT